MVYFPRRTRFRWLALTLFLIASLSLASRSLSPVRTASRPGRPATAALHGQGKTAGPPAAVAAKTPTAAAPTVAAAPAAKSLFTYVPAPADAAELEARLAAPAKEIHYVQLNQELISGKDSLFWRARPGDGHLVLPLPDGTELPLVIDHSEMVGAQRFTSEGRVEGSEGSRVVFASTDGILHAMIEDPRLGTFTLRYGNGKVSQFFKVDPTMAGSCAGSVRPVIDAGAIAAEALRKSKSGTATPQTGKDTASLDAGSSSLPAIAAETAQHAEIHLMMLYTQDVLAGVGAVPAVQSAFDLAVAMVNSDFAHSNITARVKLVKIAQVNYNEQASLGEQVQHDALAALAAPGDGKMDEIHALRDQVGADLVNLVINRSNPNSNGTSTTGIGYLLADQFSPSLANTSSWEFNALTGFTVVQYTFVNSQHVLSHELGHNLGCAHDRENARDASGNPSPGGYAYSYGYRFTGRNGKTYHDIMSYALNSSDAQLPYFSNPDIVPAETGVGNPIGIAPGQAGESDTALTIERDAFEVSIYRLQQQTPAGLGTLINVATRAFVGTGDQQLIGGFVLAGTQPKNMLVRAAGPALASVFGLTGVLADPQLSLVRTDLVPAVAVGSNDNWEQPAGAAALQAAAFAFPAGSKDAALFLSLNPGSYTVNISGAGGSTGNAMIEAYEVGDSGTRIVNLATRGYIDGSKTMIAGFVISGNGGGTKRVLLRVRGPSLAQFGITGADDPFLLLYNSVGRLLVQNDDFSTDGSLGDNYGEAQIIATGYAPSNRREPCIMVDLAPGVYTAVAQPFENSTNPAKPGMAVIEVFQIN